ncbi:MAG: tRNA 2-selenouridine(34) synthase MnmH [Burkholderiaceae bacterium]
MSLTPISAEQALLRLDEFDTLIDARSEDEFAEDHLPGALNWPTLNNAERILIGTTYKQVNAFEAKKRGAALAARNIANHIERELLDKVKDWKPLTYCWRGGKRSGSLSLVLDQIGFKVSIIEGGYKAFRAALVQDTLKRVHGLQFRVVCGTTGSGKTRLLQALNQVGAQVLDLEALASHRSSVLGAIPGQNQPSQKRFDTLVWDRLRNFDPKHPVYVESESKKVGNVAVPLSLIEAMRESPCLNLSLPQAERVALLLEDYAFFTQDQDLFCHKLDALTQARGGEVVQRWKDCVRSNQIDVVVRELLSLHYDPVYLQSMQRNFSQFAKAHQLIATDRSPQAMLSLALEMVQAASD